MCTTSLLSFSYIQVFAPRSTAEDALVSNKKAFACGFPAWPGESSYAFAFFMFMEYKPTLTMRMVGSTVRDKAVPWPFTAQELAATRRSLKEAQQKIELLNQQVAIVQELQFQMSEQDKLIAELEQLVQSDRQKQVRVCQNHHRAVLP